MSTASLLTAIKSLPEPQFVRVLGQMLAFQNRKRARQPSREQVLLAAINRGAPPRLLHEQRALIEKKRSQGLTEAERQRMIQITDALEAFNVRWLRWLAELAALRGTTAASLMRQLELPPRPYV
ncbi:MAG: hypothetical protein HS117_06365 [Verrucomicrobiaceae bacterium]|nr:hypothetical protein [Verrucomicrobiaceae bacterium]